MREFLKATLADLETLNHLYIEAREIMKESDNYFQWGDVRPSLEYLIELINENLLYKVVENNQIIGAFYVVEHDELYESEEEKWLNYDPYLALHLVGKTKKPVEFSNRLLIIYLLWQTIFV